MTAGRIARLAPLAAVLTAGCFATRNDVRLLQLDIARLQAAVASSSAQSLAELQRDRAEAARRDSIRASETRELAVLLSISIDSLQSLATQFSMFRSNASENLYALGQQLIQVQAAQGLNQARLASLMRDLESRTAAISAPPSGGGARPDSATPGTPGPATLYQRGFGMMSNAPGTARSVFGELIALHPESPYAATAMLRIAETHAAESDEASADSVFTLVTTRYPKSPEAPTALYKRGLAYAKAGQTRKAREVLERVIKDYPQAQEVALARSHLAGLPPGT